MTSSPATTTLDELKALSKLIDDSIKEIENSCVSRKVAFPSLDDPFTHETEGARMDPTVIKPASHIVAAAAQLIAIVRPPALTLITMAMQFHVPSALRVVIETNVVEILREAGPTGLHVSKIAEKNNTDQRKLARILRLLATEHIFREISPDVFTNNRISSVLDTGKSNADLLARPSERYVGSSGAAALICHFTDVAFKSSAYLTEVMLDPEYANSDEPNMVPFNKAFRTNLPIFPWFEQLGNEAHLALFSISMEGGKNMSPPDSILDGFDWKGLPEGSVVVDVGGGIGPQSLTIAKANSHLKLVVQDREPVIPEAKAFWKAQFPEALTTNQVVLQANDFMTGQPVKGAAVYFMRMILHDWADSYCRTILKHLREAASSGTKLLIIDNVISYACVDTSPLKNVPGTSGGLPPSPLLPNTGHANALGYLGDIQMMTLMNGQERTLEQLGKVLKDSGWKISQVYRAPYFAAAHQQVEAVPA